ncbi:MAG: galactokinase [Armatimonadetes bacterium]|nr:galactokinase [Armatimonadota bacterium]
MIPDDAFSLWKEYFQGDPEVRAVAPGRVNLIGEHTDYNQGLVFPVAIDRRTSGLFRAASRDQCRLISGQAGAEAPFRLLGSSPKRWTRFAWACGRALSEHVDEAVPALEGVVWSDIPKGSGLSSSAALELCLLSAWNAVGAYGLSNHELAKIAWRAETRFVGVACGVMDQMASALGEAGRAIFIDTRTEEFSGWRIPEGLGMVVMDTRKRRALASSAYSHRVDECRRSAQALGITSLRDATLEMIVECRSHGLDDVAARRARHVVTENARVLAFREGLERDHRPSIGTLCHESHQSLKYDYDVSSPELDAMVEASALAPGFVAARLTGAGFGGCCVGLIERSKFRSFQAAVLGEYKRHNFTRPHIFEVTASSGAKAGAV